MALTLKNVIAPNLEEIGRMRAKVMVNQIVNKAINDRLYEEGDMQELLLRTADDGGKIGDYTVYAYVTYDALTDGLQAADCLDFYTKHYGE